MYEGWAKLLLTPISLMVGIYRLHYTLDRFMYTSVEWDSSYEIGGKKFLKRS